MKKKGEEDPNWKNGVYIGPANIGPFTDLEKYKVYVQDCLKKGKDFLVFSAWREKFTR